MGRRGGVIQAVKDGSGDGLIECATKHGEPTLLVVASRQAMRKVPALGCGCEGVDEGSQGGTKPPPRFNGAGGDTPAFGRGVPDVFVVFTTNCGGSGNERRQPGAVGGHGVADRGVEKEFCGIEGVRGHNIKDALSHLAVFPRAETCWDLLSSVPRLGKLGNDDLQAGVVPSFPAEESKKVRDGLVDAVDAASLLAHEEVVWAPSKVCIADGKGAGVVPGRCRVMLAFPAPAGYVNPQPIEAGEGEVQVKQPEVLVIGSVSKAGTIAWPTCRQEPGLFSGTACCFTQPQKPSVLDGFDDSTLQPRDGEGRRREEQVEKGVTWRGAGDKTNCRDKYILFR